MIDNVMVNIGAAFMIVGGAVLVNGCRWRREERT